MADRILTPEEELMEDPIGYNRPNPKGSPLSTLGGFISAPAEILDLMTSTSPVKRMLGQTDTPTKTEMLHRALPQEMQTAIQEDPGSYLLGGMMTPSAAPIAKTAHRIIQAFGKHANPNIVGSTMGNYTVFNMKDIKKDYVDPKNYELDRKDILDLHGVDLDDVIYVYYSGNSSTPTYVTASNIDDIPISAIPENIRRRKSQMKKSESFKAGGEDNFKIIGEKNIGLNRRVANKMGLDFKQYIPQMKEFIKNTPSRVVNRAIRGTENNAMEVVSVSNNAGPKGFVTKTVNFKPLADGKKSSPSLNAQTFRVDKNNNLHVNCTCGYFNSIIDSKGTPKLGGVCKHIIKVWDR